MDFLFIVFAVIVVAVIIIQIAKSFNRRAAALEKQFGIKTEKPKGEVRLIANIPLRMNLMVVKSNALTRALGGMLFELPKTGDAEFDETFSISLYREDVLQVIQTNTELRRTMLQLAETLPAFGSLNYNNEKLILSLKPGASSRGDALDFARETIAAAVPALVAPFKNLPPDTVEQSRARTWDMCVPNLPLILVFILAIASGNYNQPLVTGEQTWNLNILGGVLFAALNIPILFALTKQWSARLRGMLTALFTSIFCTVAVMPGIVLGVNASSLQRDVTETVQLANLYKVVPKKGAHHYYILLSNSPSNISSARQEGAPSLEISSEIYASLENQNVHHGSQLIIDEGIGLLGLPFVVQAKPQ